MAKRKRRLTIDGIEKWKEIDKQVLESEDRVSAIVAVAVLEELTRRVLEHHFTVKGDSIDALFGNALRPFGARVELAWALGIIGDNARKDLKRMGDIRNEFAHNALLEEDKAWRHVTFSATPICDHCRELYYATLYRVPDVSEYLKGTRSPTGKVPMKPTPKAPRDRFHLNYFLLKSGLLQSLSRRSKKPGWSTLSLHY